METDQGLHGAAIQSLYVNDMSQGCCGSRQICGETVYTGLSTTFNYCSEESIAVLDVSLLTWPHIEHFISMHGRLHWQMC